MNKKYIYFIIVLLILTSAIAFGRILGNGFINFDDPAYITANHHVRSGISLQSIKWASTAVVSGNWHPLTMISHTLDSSIFGANASGHHFVSLLLHIGSAILLFLFLNKTTGSLWPSAFVAALFALHPLRVESVAWAAERKDVLSMFLGLASIYAYVYYVESSKLSKYFISLILFALSLMAKPMLVTLPFVLLLLDYWPLGRWPKAGEQQLLPVSNENRLVKNKFKQRKTNSTKHKKISMPLMDRAKIIRPLLWEKAPFIFLTIVSSIVTIWAQNKHGLIASMEEMPFFVRVQNAVISYVSYLGKTFWPVDLVIVYPYAYFFPLWQILASCFILIGITIVVIYAIRKLPFLFVGWFWYLGTLIPVIGLVQVATQAMADRYTYLPSIGITIMLVWGIPHLFPREDIRKKILFPVAIAVLSILAVLTWRQCGYWKNSIELFNHCLQITKNNPQAQNNFGLALFEKGKIEEAISHYNESIRVAPDALGCYNRGNAYAELGQYQRAIEDYNESIRIVPDAMTCYNRGNAYANIGQYQRAIEDYNEAIRIEPDYTNAYYYYYGRGNAYAKLGQYQRAIEDHNEAIRLKPDFAETYNNRGHAYNKLGQYQRAIEDQNEAIRLKPDLANDYYNSGNAYAKIGQYQRAIEDYNEAIRLKPDFAETYNNRGVAYFTQGNKKLGCRDAHKACELGKCKILEMAKGKGDCR